MENQTNCLCSMSPGSKLIMSCQMRDSPIMAVWSQQGQPAILLKVISFHRSLRWNTAPTNISNRAVKCAPVLLKDAIRISCLGLQQTIVTNARGEETQCALDSPLKQTGTSRVARLTVWIISVAVYIYNLCLTSFLLMTRVISAWHWFNCLQNA